MTVISYHKKSLEMASEYARRKVRSLRSIYQKIEGFCLIIIAVLLSGHYLSTAIPYFQTRMCILMGVLFVLPPFLKCGRQVLVLKEPSEKYVSLFVCAAVLSIIANFEFHEWLAYVIFTVFLLTASTVVKKYTFDQFKKSFHTVLTFISIVSLIMMLLILLGIRFSLGTIENVNGVVYMNNYIQTYNSSPYAIVRNYGCFWEPGLFATMLIYGIVLEGLAEKKSVFRIVLYTITVLTTLSAAGYVLLIPALVFAVTCGRTNQKRNLLWEVMVLAFVLLLMILSETVIEYISREIPVVGNKLFSGSSLSISTSRLDSIVYNFKLFMENPIFGKGCYGANIAYGTDIAQTSTFGYMLAAYGVLGVAYIWAWVSAIFKCPNTSVLGKAMLFIVFFSIQNKEPHTYILISWVLLFYLLNYDKTKLSNA